MGQIIFYKTNDLDKIQSFYQEKLGFNLWLDQGSCKILKGKNLLIGFCEGDVKEEETIITFFYKTKEEVDLIYNKYFNNYKSPIENKKYNIYQFFAKDPEGRTLEFQHFLHPIDWVWDKV